MKLAIIQWKQESEKRLKNIVLSSANSLAGLNVETNGFYIKKHFKQAVT